jgi:hypothetical protein
VSGWENGFIVPRSLGVRERETMERITDLTRGRDGEHYLFAAAAAGRVNPAER